MLLFSDENSAMRSEALWDFLTRKTAKGPTVDHISSFGFTLVLNGINTICEQPLLTRFGESDHRIATEESQPFPAVWLVIPEAPSFMPIGLNRELETIAFEQLVGLEPWLNGRQHQ